jgi:lipopolysaccharide transport system permease protein
VTTALRSLVDARDLWTNLTLREFRSKYKRSALGWGWSLLNPLASIGIYWLVFGVFLDVQAPVGDPSGVDLFVLYLVCGLLPWTFMANGLSAGLASVVANSALVKKVWFPREVLITSVVASWFISFCIEMSVATVLLVVGGSEPYLYLPLVFVVMLFQAVFIVGVGLGLSALNVYFRDVSHLFGLFLQLWFYLTPIVYSINQVPESHELAGVNIPVRDLLSLNPMLHFVDCYRALLYDNRWPAFSDMAWVVVSAIVAVVVGWRVFRRYEPTFAEEL